MDKCNFIDFLDMNLPIGFVFDKTVKWQNIVV